MSAAIRVYMEEEHELFREAIKSRLSSDDGIDLINSSTEPLAALGRADELLSLLHDIEPDIFLVGTKVFDTPLLRSLIGVRRELPSIGNVLICSRYDMRAAWLLRGYFRKNRSASAYLLRASVDSADALARVIHAVNEGRVVVDPELYSWLIDEGMVGSFILKSLDQDELTILNWMSRGYNDSAIAEILSLEPATLEAHIRSILVKLGPYLPPSRIPRVAAILAFLRATGDLIDRTESLWEADMAGEEVREAQDASVGLSTNPV